MQACSCDAEILQENSAEGGSQSTIRTPQRMNHVIICRKQEIVTIFARGGDRNEVVTKLCD